MVDNPEKETPLTPGYIKAQMLTLGIRCNTFDRYEKILVSYKFEKG